MLVMNILCNVYINMLFVIVNKHFIFYFCMSYYWRPYQRKVLVNPRSYSFKTYRSQTYENNELNPKLCKSYLDFMIVNQNPDLQSYVDKQIEDSKSTVEINNIQFNLVESIAHDPPDVYMDLNIEYFNLFTEFAETWDLEQSSNFEISMINYNNQYYPFSLLVALHNNTLENPEGNVMICIFLVYSMVQNHFLLVV